MFLYTFVSLNVFNMKKIEELHLFYLHYSIPGTLDTLVPICRMWSESESVSHSVMSESLQPHGL